ncbi:hypothetical protein K2173_027614 [Erythroxylum novogranatense]|uniref:KIB1-4 beta-propeller domain-containing protein n=1 Tax=Erythroxylum novogranatense TaxID=1862640 RepID=A0AAV8TZI5_9ROSI|nr:hypothetical protein K2173_027614 [Erythroxylum novogranatense]
MSNGWADLPKELLSIIGQRLDTHIDVCRFRAVCSSFRSTVPPSHRPFPRVVFQLPPPVFSNSLLSQIIICRVQPAHETPSDSNANRSWLTKVEESTHGELQLLAPFRNHQLKNSPGKLPKTLNLLEFRLLELCRGYTLKLARGISVFGINKVVLFPNSNSVPDNVNGYGLLAILHEGKLCYWSYGEEKWTFVDEKYFHYDDILIYRGQFYVVDRWGTVWWVDSSLKLIPYSPPLYGCGHMKHLVESSGDLYVVDRYLEGNRRTWTLDESINLDMNNNLRYLGRNYPICRAETVDIKIYKLNEEWGTWDDVTSLGDQIFVLGHECCFSVSANEIGGCEGNSVYFTDPIDEDLRGEISGSDARVYKLADGCVMKAEPWIFSTTNCV